MMDSSEEGRIHKILLIEDDRDYRNLLKTYLTKNLEGVEIVEYDPVSKGAPAENFDWSSYDILILDYYLCIYGLTGLDLLQKHRKKPGFPATLMITGAGDEEVAVRALNFGVYEFLHKEKLTREGLIESVKNAFTRHRSNQEKVREQEKVSKVFDKKLFYQELEHPSGSGTGNKQRALLRINIDGMDGLISEFGFIVFDNLLRHFARSSFDVFKTIYEELYITRLSDTSVAVLIEGPHAGDKFEKEIHELNNYFQHNIYVFGDKPVPCTVSIGVLIIDEEDHPLDLLIKVAGQASNLAGQKPGNSSHVISLKEFLEQERLRQEEDKHKQKEQQKREEEEKQREIERQALVEERRQLAEEKRRLEELRQQEAEEKRKEEEEERKLQAERQQLVAERQQLVAEKQKLEEEERKRLEELRRREAEEKRKEEEEERKLQAERQQLEAERRQLAEEKQRLEEEERKRLEEVQQREAEKKHKEKERQELEEENKRNAEEEEKLRIAEIERKHKQEEERLRQLELDRQHQQQEAKRKAEEERKRREEQQRLLAEKKEKLRLAEEERKRKEEKLRQLEEQSKKAEELRRKEKDAKQKDEEFRRQIENIRRKSEENERLRREKEEQQQLKQQKVVEEKEIPSDTEILSFPLDISIPAEAGLSLEKMQKQATEEQKKVVEKPVPVKEPARVTRDEKKDKNVEVVPDHGDVADEAELTERALALKKAFNENRGVSTFQPIVAMNATENTTVLFKAGVRIIDSNGNVIAEEEIKKLNKFYSLQQFIDHWLIREIVGRIVNSAELRSGKMFIINISEAWLKDITLFNWLQKLLTGLENIKPGKYIILKIPAPMLTEHQKRALPLVNALKKSYGFRIALGDIESVDELSKLSGLLDFKLYIGTYKLIEELCGIAEENEKLIENLKKTGARFVVDGIEDSTMLTTAVSQGADYVMGSFIGGPETFVAATGNVESLDII